MITQITSIKSLGIFYDFTANSTTPNLKRYTLIYGWNGSGKTTLSRLFEALPNEEHHKFASLKYSVVDEGLIYTQSSSYPRPVAVFNRHFVKENAPSIDDPEAPSKHIFMIGAKDKKLAKQVQDSKDEREKLTHARDIDDKATGRVSLNTLSLNDIKLRDKTFTDLARTIAAIGSGKAVRNYKSPQAQMAFKALTKKGTLSAADLERNLALVGQEIRQELPLVHLDGLDKEVADILKNSAILMQRTITRTVIKELDNDREYADWAGKGYRMHSDHGDKAQCMFCGQSMPNERWNLLEGYFNKKYEEIVKEITDERSKLRSCYDRIIKLELADSASVYPDLKKDYETALKSLADSKKITLGQVEKVGKTLNEKLAKLSTELTLTDTIDLSSITESVALVNNTIGVHNKRSRDFEKSQGDTFNRLETHYLSQQYDAIVDLNRKIEERTKKINEHTGRISVLDKEISDNEGKLRDTRIACAELNELIKQLLGRDEIQLEDKDNGYFIRRNGSEIAHGLSEGEQTTIAFAYFLTTLKNNGGSVKDKLIVIDDPISSLDADSIYRVGSLIKTRMNGAHQLIVMTHNYDLLNHIKKWFRIGEIKDQSTMLMIKNPIVDKKRTATITDIDPLISKYESEYHYLFARLLNFDSETEPDDRGTIAGVYHYPNIARKVLECYLSFRTPGSDVYAGLCKLKKLGTKSITSSDVDDVHSFVNSHSHLDSKTGLIQFDLTLAKNAEEYIKKTLEIIEKSDEQHYKSMVKEVGV